MMNIQTLMDPSFPRLTIVISVWFQTLYMIDWLKLIIPPLRRLMIIKSVCFQAVSMMDRLTLMVPSFRQLTIVKTMISGCMYQGQTYTHDLRLYGGCVWFLNVCMMVRHTLRVQSLQLTNVYTMVSGCMYQGQTYTHELCL